MSNVSKDGQTELLSLALKLSKPEETNIQAKKVLAECLHELFRLKPNEKHFKTLALILQNLFETAEDNWGPVQVVLCKQIDKIIENYFLHVDLAAYTSKILQQRDKLLRDRNAHLTLPELGE